MGGDEQAARGTAERDVPTAGGVDASASKKHLQQVAAELGIPGRSTMSKDDLVEAIQKTNDRRTARARDKSDQPPDLAPSNRIFTLLSDPRNGDPSDLGPPVSHPVTSPVRTA